MEHWLPAIVIFIYLAVVLYIGIFAFRRGRNTGEDFFLASRSIGSIFFFLALFATNMTAFAILGSSGMSYKIGIGVFGMMATSSALVIPLTLFFIGTRLWAVGKRFGHMTQVAFFRDRWDCSFIGTIIFLVTAAMLVPYLIISIDGGGTILSALTDQRIPYWLGGAIVATIVMATVFFGGMRGAVWVNVLQTLLFIGFGLFAFGWIGTHMPKGFTGAVHDMVAEHANPPTMSVMARPEALLTRERIPWQVFLSFMLIPLSSIMFPHMSMMCFTAKRVTAFKKTVILYPICIMAIWLPCVFLGALGAGQKPVRDKVSANSEPLKVWLENRGKTPAKGEEFAGLLGGLNKALHAAATAKPPTMTISAPRPGGAARSTEGPDLPPELANSSRTRIAQDAQKRALGFAAAIAASITREQAAPVAALLADVHAGKYSAKSAEDRLTVVHRLDAIRSPQVKAAWGKVAANNSDSVLLEMLKTYVPAILGGILAAGIISAVMGSDCHQILGLSTMFTKDIFNYYGSGRQMSDRTIVNTGRAFILILNGVAYVIALGRPPIFDLAVTYAFSGFAALAPMMIAALFWRRSTKWGALACTLWAAGWVAFMVYAEGFHHYSAGQTVWGVGHARVLFMSPAGKLSFFGFTPVVPMTLGGAVVTILASLATPAPSSSTIARYFPAKAPRESGNIHPTIAA